MRRLTRVDGRFLAGVTLGLLGLVLATLTACGSPEPDEDGVASLAGASPAANATPTPTSTMSEEDRAFKFAACMRENGVDMPDPEVNESGGIKMRIGGSKDHAPDPKTVEAAQRKCRQYEPFGGKPPKLSAEELEAMQKMAQCMRDHGVDMPDPDDSGRIHIQSGERKPGKGSNAVGMNPDDPKVEAALKACEKYMPRRDQKAKP